MEFNIKHPIILIKQCPVCKNKNTGYYVLGDPRKDLMKRYKKALKGENIRTIYDIILPYNNCFCNNCNMTWHQDLKYSWLSKKEIEKIKKDRMINDNIQSMNNANKGTKETFKRKNKIKYISSVILYFIFGRSIKRIKENQNYIKKKIDLYKKMIKNKKESEE